ncbi:MAG: sulfotransferase [Bdellovibrionota bacterium]
MEFRWNVESMPSLCRIATIFSAPGSGSAILCDLLSRHSKIATAPQTPWIYDAESRHSLGAFLDFLQSAQGPGGSLAGVNDDFLCAEVQQLLTHVFKQYLANQEKDFLILHAPESKSGFEALMKVLPRQKIIHFIRDGRDVAEGSHRRTSLVEDHESSKLLSAHLALQEWVRMNNEMSLYAKSIPDSVLVVSYESLCQSPGQELERICKFLDLPFEAGLLDGNFPDTHSRIGKGGSPASAARKANNFGPRYEKLGHLQRYLLNRFFGTALGNFGYGRFDYKKAAAFAELPWGIVRLVFYAVTHPGVRPYTLRHLAGLALFPRTRAKILRPKRRVHLYPKYNKSAYPTVLEGNLPDCTKISSSRSVAGQYDILHVQWYEHAIGGPHPFWRLAGFVFGVLSGRLRGRRLIWTIHNITPHEAPPAHLDRFLRAFLFRFAHKVFVLNPRDARYIRRYFPRAMLRTEELSHPIFPRKPQTLALDGRVHWDAWIQRVRARKEPLLLALGLLRPYKSLNRIRGILQESSASMIVAGVDRCNVDELLDLQKVYPDRLLLILRYVQDSEVTYLVDQCDALTVLHDRITNSGIPFLALSHGKPVIVSKGTYSSYLKKRFAGNFVHEISKHTAPGDWETCARTVQGLTVTTDFGLGLEPAEHARQLNECYKLLKAG